MKFFLRRFWLIALCLSAGITLMLIVIVTSGVLLPWQEMERRTQGPPLWEFGQIHVQSLMKAQLFPARAPDIPPKGLKESERKRIDAIRRRIEARYGIEIRIYDPSELKRLYNIEAAAYPTGELEGHLRHLHSWLQKYPPVFIKQIGLKGVHLFRDWKRDGVDTGGFLIDKSSIGMSGNEYVLHHELWHLADIQDGSLTDDNAEWLRAKFGDDRSATSEAPGSYPAIAEGWYMEPRPRGYASAYGKYAGADEDQATTVEALFVIPKTLLQWAKDEPELLAGVEYIEKFYAAHSNGLMNAAYFADLAKGVAFDDTYWNMRSSASQ